MRDLLALKAPAGISPGQRPGCRRSSNVARPEGARGPSAPSGRPNRVCLDSQGVALGYYPSRRRRAML